MVKSAKDRLTLTAMPKPSARELLNLPEGYRVRRYRKGELDVAWVGTGREPDRRCPRCGARGHVNGTADLFQYIGQGNGRS